MTVDRIEGDRSRRLKLGYKENIFFNHIDTGAMGQERTVHGTVEFVSDDAIRFTPTLRPEAAKIYSKEEINSMTRGEGGFNGSIQTDGLLDFLSTHKEIMFRWTQG